MQQKHAYSYGFLPLDTFVYIFAQLPVRTTDEFIPGINLYDYKLQI